MILEQVRLEYDVADRGADEAVVAFDVLNDTHCLFENKNMILRKIHKNNRMITIIDAHRGGGGGGTLCTPSKDLEKLGHKNAIKNENRGHPLIFMFSYKPQGPLSKEFENDCE